MAKVEVKIEEIQKDVEEIKCSQKEHNTKLDKLIILIAEAQGAAKLGKWFIGVISTLGAAIFGWAGSKVALAGKTAAIVGTVADIIK